MDLDENSTASSDVIVEVVPSDNDIDTVLTNSIVDDIGTESDDRDDDFLKSSSHESVQSSDDDVIIVNNWDELQYYCAQTDKDYTLKLKENTNFYPSNPTDNNQQIKIKNNVKITGGEGSYIGDNSSDVSMLKFVAFLVEDNANVGMTLENITFKWIKATYPPKEKDGIFIQIGGKKNTIIRNCQFSDITVKSGHATIVYLKKGSATLDNCSFINCTSEYGAVSVYDPSSVKSVSMVVRNCYFENNYAGTEPGCINNCGKLTVYNTTFFKNRSFWWAGAIHTHNGGNTTIYDSNFTDNVAGWNGGALYTYGYLQIYNSVFVGNNCTTNNGGGAIGACQYQSNPHIYIEKCLFENNANNCWALDELSTSGTGRGGAISLMDEGSIEVRDTTFIANAASIGAAICAIEVGSYGSPDIIIVNNTFINHTRMGDVLNVRVKDTILNISDNYFYGNSIVFSDLTLVKLSEGKEQATLQVSASLKNPSYYDDDILDKTLYDVYINDKYVKTVNSTVFTVDFGDLDICDVYVIPTISNRKSNEVTITSTREYVFVSKSNGKDSNNGISRETPVNSIKRALELAGNCQNIILLDGDYSESGIQIDYAVNIKGESDATLTGATSFISNANFTLKNLKINNLDSENFIKQNKDNLIISNCIFINNNAVLVYNNGFTSLTNSILLNNSKVVEGNINNCVFDYNWWGNVPSDLSNYITLNLTSDVDALENNQKSNVKAVFYLNDGSKYTKLPDINLDINALNGVVSKSTVNVDSGFVYTLTAFDDGVLTLTYNNVNVTKSFEFLKSNPCISFETNDIMVGDNVVVTVTTPSDAEGNLTVNVGNVAQTKLIQSTKSVFTFDNLKADTYNITLTYSGDKKYLSKEFTSKVNVNKYESTTQLELGAVNVGGDVVITINTIQTSTGNVTLSINDNVQTLTLTDSKAIYTIKNIKRGDYRIAAVYNGDSKYLSSSASKFIEVDNLNATMSILANDITYGDVAVIKVTLNDDATGNVIVTVDGVSNQSEVNNGKAEVTLANLDAGSGKKISVFYSGDDTYFNLTKSSTFNIAKADLNFTISSKDIKIGQFAEITITVPSRTAGTFTIDDDVINIPMSGEISYVIADLEIGNYTYTATYNGNNYYTVSKTISFTVSEYPIPQVKNEGLNTGNTHKSQYETETNGNIAFTIPFNETLSGDLLIDSFGNIYVPTQSGIYSFNQTNKLWYFTSGDVAGDLSGIAVLRDVVVAPKSGDTLYFINQTSGVRWGESNIYQGSSLFAPIVDDSANLYIVSEYQTQFEDYELTIIPYALWEKGGDPTLISMGNYKPLCAPTLNENIIVVLSDGRLRFIDANSLSTIAIKSGSYMPVRPIVGDGNIVYVVLSDSVVAYNSNGVQVWKTKVIGGVGSVIALDNGQGLYHVNSRGIIYKYDIADGTQSKFSDLKVTSGILIDANSNLYFGSNNMFYALDSEGNILWKSDLNSKIIGNPVMDVYGLIYVPTEKGIVALDYAPLSDCDLKVSVDDIVEGQKATITVTWNNQATGSVLVSVNGEDITVNAADAKVTKVLSDLNKGYYDISVSYSGDMRFKESDVTKTFVVRSIEDVANNIHFDGNSTFTFTLNNAQGNLTVNVAGKTYTRQLVNGQSSITVDELAPGYWDAVVIYSGDRQYSAGNRTFTVEIPKYSVDLNEVITTENIVTRIIVSLPSDATGNLTLSVGTKKYSETVVGGKAVIVVDDLPEGNYSATLTYSGDSNYESISKTVSINPVKISVILDDSNVIVRSGDNPNVSIKLSEDATGTLIVTVDGLDYSVNLVGGEASVDIDLDPGNYSVKITYSGDNLYSKASKTANLEVPKICLELNESTLIISTGKFNATFTLSLPGDAYGDFMVLFDGKNYTQTLRNGVSKISIDNLDSGNYEATVVYSGCDKYEYLSKISTFSISMVEIVFSDDTLTVVSPSKVPGINVNLGGDVTGNVTVIVNNKEFKVKLINGEASLNISGLTPGIYRANVIYSGDSKYATFDKTVSLEVPKISLDLNDLVVVSNVSVPVVCVVLPSDATGILTVNVNGKTFTQNVVNGEVNLNITGLAPGNYSGEVIYSGDNNYSNASKMISFEVPKINVDFDSLIVDSNADKSSFSVVLPLDAVGSLTVVVNERSYFGELINGQSFVEITDLNPGNYSATVIYSGDAKYESVSKTIGVEVPKAQIKLDGDTLINGDSLTYTVSLPADATGTLTVNVDGLNYTVNVSGGKATVSVFDVDSGIHNITVTYSGDGKYESISKSDLIEVYKLDCDLTVSVDDITVGENAVVSVKISAKATGNVSLNINNKDYTALISDGAASISVPNLDVGTYTVTVKYVGDVKFNEAVNTTSFNVLKINIPVTDETISIPENGSNYSVSLPSDATGTLTVTVDGKEYSEILVNGKATVNIPELAEGSHNITVIYSGDDKYSPISKSNIVVIDSENTTNNNTGNTTVPSVSVPDESFTIPESGNEYSISLPSDATGTLTVTVDGVSYSQELVNGKATVNIPELREGSHNVTVTYSGDSKYVSTSKSSVVVKSGNTTDVDNNSTGENSTAGDNNSSAGNNTSVPSVSVPDESFTIPESGNEYSISLPSDATGTLTVTVDGKAYSQNLTNGKATVIIPELAEGSHNITVAYSGDGKYAPTVKSTVVVKEHVPVINITGSNLSMLYSSGKYFKVRLTSDGQPLANNDVKIIINGKTFTKTTDKNGYASLKITLAPKAYTVKATYGDLTVSKKVTVKSIVKAKNMKVKKSAKSVKIKVTLKKVNKKYLKSKKVSLKFRGKTYKVKTNKKGVATFTIKKNVLKKLKAGKKYSYKVTYGKDTVKKTITVKK